MSNRLFGRFFSLFLMCSFAAVSIFSALGANPLKRKKVVIHQGIYEFQADYLLSARDLKRPVLVHVNLGAHVNVLHRCVGSPIVPGRFSVRLQVNENKKKGLFEIVPTYTGSLRFFNFQNAALMDQKALFEAFGASLCEKFLPLDERVRGRNIYTSIASEKAHMGIKTYSRPLFKACYQLRIIPRVSKHALSSKTQYVFVDTFLKKRKKGKPILVSKIKLDQEGHRRSRYSKILFLHTSHGLKEISSKRLQHYWLPWVKLLAKRNAHHYRLFYNMHEKIVETVE